MTLRASVHFNLNDATPIADFEAWIAKCPAGICDHTILWGDAADKPWKDPDQESQIQALIDSKIALLQKFFGATDVVPSENDTGDTILALKAGDQVVRTGTLSELESMVVDIFHQLIGHNSIMAQKLAETGHDPNALIDSVEPEAPTMGEPLNPGETVDPAIAGAPSGTGAEIKMMDVISSNLKQVGYDEGAKTLYIRFTSGTSLWEYAGVPVEVYQDMLAAKSLGAFFASNIKGKYESTEHKSAAA